MMSQQEDRQTATARARAVKEAHQAKLMAKANVVGVGIGMRRKGGDSTGQVALIVMVDRKVSPGSLSAADLIPSEIDGVPVDVQEVGQIHAQDTAG